MTLTEPQTWTLIVGFLSAIFVMLGLVTTSFNRTIRAEVGRIEGTFAGRFESLETRLISVENGIEGKVESLRSEMNVKFDSVDRRLSDLDRDVQALAHHTFGRPE